MLRNVDEVPTPTPPFSRDEEVRETNSDATSCKYVAVKKGYYRDEFIEPFMNYVPSKQINARPIMNRGYYLRVYAFNTVLERWLNTFGSFKNSQSQQGIQVVSLGSGFDTTFFRCKSAGIKFLKYFEVDFAEIVSKKVEIIRKTAQLSQLLDDVRLIQTPAPPPSSSSIPPLEHASESDTNLGLDSSTYSVVAGDLRCVTHLHQTLLSVGLDPKVPTLFLSECVLIYIESAKGNEVLRWITSTFPSCGILTYEQILPFDQFGRVMQKSLIERGCPLLSFEDYPDSEAQIRRYRNEGFQNATCEDLASFYRQRIPNDERIRIERLEWLDEVEEWFLILSHYCLVWAFNVNQSIPDPIPSSPHHHHPPPPPVSPSSLSWNAIFQTSNPTSKLIQNPHVRK